jgi:Zn-dependent alcohol dehydrogenase
MIAHELKLEDINKAVHRMHSGESIPSLVVY